MCMGGGSAQAASHRMFSEEEIAAQKATSEADTAKRAAAFEAQRQAALGQRQAIVRGGTFGNAQPADAGGPAQKQLLGQ